VDIQLIAARWREGVEKVLLISQGRLSLLPSSNPAEFARTVSAKIECQIVYMDLQSFREMINFVHFSSPASWYCDCPL